MICPLVQSPASRSRARDAVHACIGQDSRPVEKATRRGNYESGSDYVLEYGELRFSFNEQDFAQRVEQAAVKLDFVDQGLAPEELHDLLELAVNGEILEPTSALGEHINEHWTELVGPRTAASCIGCAASFPGAWSISASRRASSTWSSTRHHAFGYVQPDRDAGADRAFPRALLGPPRLKP